MEKNTYKIIIILLLLFVLMLPGVTMIAGFGNVYSINENRKRSTMPDDSLVNGFIGNGDYWRNVETTFNDNFGCRDLLIRCKNQINYSIFKYSSELYFGKDGYFSYYSVIANEQVLNEKMSDNQLKSIINQYKRIKEILNEKEIKLVVMVPPQKNTVFPSIGENYPVKRPMPNAYERFCELSKQSDIKDNFVDMIPLLREANEYSGVL